MAYLEPMYLNEKMVLNAAAYLFKGVSTESEEKASKSASGKANAKLGFSLLQVLIGKADIGVEGSRSSANEVKTVKRYTLGGLHMVVVDELSEIGEIKEVKDSSGIGFETGQYIKTKAVLQPVDIFQLVEMLQTSAPLIVQILRSFGAKIGVEKKFLEEFLKHEKPIMQIIEAIEADYLKSKQLEMLLCHPKTGEAFGVVDLDVNDCDPKEVKAKLTDGEFVIIGKVTKRVECGKSLSLVQRTFLSYIMSNLDKLMAVSNHMGSFENYRGSIDSIRPMVDGFCRLSIEGPAYRMTAMSVSA